jgi:hypothetical protein
MPTYIINPPAGITERDAGRIQDFLTNKGIVVDGVSVSVDRETQAITYIIDADRNPLTLFDGPYARPKNADETARDKLIDLKAKILDGTATVAEMRQALYALIVLHGI